MKAAAGKKADRRVDGSRDCARAPATCTNGAEATSSCNRATMHRGRPWPAHEPRVMVRTTISATAADGVDTMRCHPHRQRIALVVHGPALRALHSASANPDTASRVGQFAKARL